MPDRTAIRNTACTVALLVLGYVLPFVGDHLSGSRGTVETLLFLLEHTYFRYYLNTAVLTALVMGGVWYHIEVRHSSRHFVLIGSGYGLFAGVVFAVFYVLLGVGVYSFAPQESYVLILVGIGTVVGVIAGTLREARICYR